MPQFHVVVVRCPQCKHQTSMAFDEKPKDEDLPKHIARAGEAHRDATKDVTHVHPRSGKLVVVKKGKKCAGKMELVKSESAVMTDDAQAPAPEASDAKAVRARKSAN